MSETIIVGIISAGAALIGAAIGALASLWHSAKSRESEERRWYASYFMDKKITALNDLYAALIDCHETMNFYGNCPPSTLTEFREQVEPKMEKYQSSFVRASIYLDNKTEKVMRKALSAFRQAKIAIYLHLPDDQCQLNKAAYDTSRREVDWSQLGEAYEQATATLRNLLNPQVLTLFQDS